MLKGQDLIEWVNRRFMRAGNDGYLSAVPFANENQYNWFKNAEWDYNWLVVKFPNKAYKFRTSTDYTAVDNEKVCTVTYIPEADARDEFSNPILDIEAKIYKSASYTIADNTDMFSEFYVIMQLAFEMM